MRIGIVSEFVSNIVGMHIIALSQKVAGQSQTTSN